ncbi:CAF17-like 4Fe-4S cluster assembly/insertion protein YgfZ [Terrihabitans sp. B22-R8]|uniref:CAF17-like 4Fe-4S cluster assembly/insertion protein YgfZ n=1 Tax=Terrihabitans sp. B22-R8 TaxID=3425128 RepID=UPI00403C0CDC
MKAAILTDRAVLRVAGPDAPHFLHNLVTSSVESLKPGEARYSALLTPQGKIIADFIVVHAEDGYLLDVPTARIEDLKRRLTLYKLRAKVTLTIEDYVVAAFFGDFEGDALTMGVVEDPRLAALGRRALLPRDQVGDLIAAQYAQLVDEAAYHTHRVSLGVPEGGRDFGFEDAFPHEADLDQLGGVDFRKGCYIGQEVVSRMQHRSTARTRVVPVRLSGPAQPGDEILAGERKIGTLGSVADDRALALLRIDRADDALAAGEPMMAGSAQIVPVKPDWARFRFPGEPLRDAAQ